MASLAVAMEHSSDHRHYLTVAIVAIDWKAKIRVLVTVVDPIWTIGQEYHWGFLKMRRRTLYCIVVVVVVVCAFVYF